MSWQQYGRCCSGFTLMEMVISMFIMVMVLTGVTSSIVIAARSVGHNSSNSLKSHETRDAVSRLIDEVAFMTSIDTCKPELLVFTIPDRDGDSTEEWLEYEWPGSAGDPLVRTFNSGDVDLVVPEAKKVEFECTYRQEEYQEQGPDEDSSPQIIDSYYSGNDHFENDGSFIFSQYIEPVLPGGIKSWKPEGVWILCRNDPGHAAGQMKVDIYLAEADRTPSNKKIATGTIKITSWSMDYYYVEVNGGQTIEPGEAICLCMKSQVNHIDMGFDDDWGTNMARSDNNGVSWKFYSNGHLIYGIVGTHQTDGSLVTKTRDYLSEVSITIENNDPREGTYVTGVRVLNEPEKGGS